MSLLGVQFISMHYICNVVSAILYIGCVPLLAVEQFLSVDLQYFFILVLYMLFIRVIIAYSFFGLGLWIVCLVDPSGVSGMP